MTDLPESIVRTPIWRNTLAPQQSDPYELARMRLRNAFVSFRDRAALLATEVRRDLPDLTVHDVTHLDALWEVASSIVGPEYQFTPTEAFVLGGAILLHDLAMSVAATPGGLKGLQADPRWADVITSEYLWIHHRRPSAADLAAPEQKILQRALFALLRLVHAENAERLAFLSYTSSAGTPLFLLEDAEIRQAFGRSIGQVAHSHWWSIEEVERRFASSIGTLPWCPPEWTVDPLKVACALRVADAAHLDASRAPTFLKAISQIEASSEPHWRFQEKLVKPYLKDDALVFTSGDTFRLADATAWWLCLESLRMVDRELRSVDALLADKGKARFSARRVAGVDTPERLAGFVTTDRWLPINATLHVTDLPRLIRNLGGKELYGARPEVTLRELIQNACDAIRARRLFQRRDEAFGSIVVLLSEDPNGTWWLEVDDDGIGMSKIVLTDFLLDFGRSFWGSAQMLEEFPGLLASGVRPTGKYGIGFFSVFMIADHVQVITRRCDLGMSDTLVLEFGSGLAGRPVLRAAEKAEQQHLLDGGTRIRLRLKKAPGDKKGLLWDSNERRIRSLNSLCRRLAPAIDANLFAVQDGQRTLVVSAGDWRQIPAEQLIARLEDEGHKYRSRERAAAVKKLSAKALMPLVDSDGTTVGRASITSGYASRHDTRDFVSGIVTVGGLAACEMSGIVGILVGESRVASRDAAKPVVSDEELKKWASEQAVLIASMSADDDYKTACAQYVRLCGGHTGPLPIALNRARWIAYSEIVALARDSDRIIIVDHFEFDSTMRVLKNYKPLDNVLVTHTSGIPGLLHSNDKVRWPADVSTDFVTSSIYVGNTLGGAVLEAIADGWNITGKTLAKFNELRREKDVRIGKKGKAHVVGQALDITKPSAQPEIAADGASRRR